MLPSDKEERKKMIGYMLIDCRKMFDDLTAWEKQFIDSIEEQVEEGKDLTYRQGEILEKIYEKLT